MSQNPSRKSTHGVALQISPALHVHTSSNLGGRHAHKFRLLPPSKTTFTLLREKSCAGFESQQHHITSPSLPSHSSRWASFTPFSCKATSSRLTWMLHPHHICSTLWNNVMAASLASNEPRTQGWLYNNSIHCVSVDKEQNWHQT